MLDNIPAEMRNIPQWVCAGSNKEPINPRTGQPASVTDPSSWGTFMEARQAGYMHVGFVLTKADPYSIIDLDAPLDDKQAEVHKRIFEAFNSYAELSQSGNGVHIVVRGSIPSGVRRNKVEVYADSRYMICTGNIIRDCPITDHQPLLEAIHHEMASTVYAELEERAEVMTDEYLYTMAVQALNGRKFKSLWDGDISGYPSQSEADFALLTILCFYSKADEQVRRVFRYSSLGQRDKAVRNDDYLNRALGKIRGRQSVPLVDLSALLAPKPEPTIVFEQPPDAVEMYLPTLAPVQPSITFPVGLVGEMSAYVLSSAIRPVHEVALCAGLGLAAGMLGRCYNISGTGLNQYLVLLAGTGTGKEGAPGGIDAMVASMRSAIPAADQFLGPGTFASGQAMTRVLDNSPSFVSVLGEVGITLQQICDKNASPHHLQLRKVLLDIYAKSGWNKWLRPSVYSDTEKNTQLVRAPNVTILGESTPENFYTALDSSHISEGLIPRFLVIEYSGPRPVANPRAFHPVDPGLVSKLVQAAQISLTMRSNDQCCPVQIDHFALHLLDEYNRHTDAKINDPGADEVTKQLWNRAHLKALKLCGLIAVGCHIHQPIVTKEIATWALDVVNRDIDNMTAKFASGVVGQGDHQQEAEIRKAVDHYPELSEKQRKDYKVPSLLLDKITLIPYVFIKRWTGQRASFKADRRGAVVALKGALEDMVRSGILCQVPEVQARTELGVDSPVYYKGQW